MARSVFNDPELTRRYLSDPIFQGIVKALDLAVDRGVTVEDLEDALRIVKHNAESKQRLREHEQRRT